MINAILYFWVRNLSQKSTSFLLPMGVDFSDVTKVLKQVVHG
jgi:hypothetical protein